MSILDIFRTPPVPVAPQAAPPGNIPLPNAPVIDPGTTPPTAAPVETNNEVPLDKFKDLWETNPTDPNAPAAPVPLTAEALQKTSIATADFTSGITPETLAAITAGGDDAAAAFSQAMNAVAQQVMIKSTLVNDKLTQKAVAEAKLQAEASIPELLRQQNAANHLNHSNPVFQNPAIKPFIESAQAQLLIKHPNATPSELTDMTTDLMSAIQETFAPEAPKDPSKPNETDWTTFA